jgi:hypothetical protein
VTTKPKRRLKDLSISSVHLVSEGDNPEARIALFKRKEDEAEIDALAKATAEEIEAAPPSEAIATIEAAKEALLYIASLMRPDAPSDEAALFEYSRTVEGQETIQKVREAELPSRRDVEKAEGSEAPKPQTAAHGQLIEKAKEISEAEGVRPEIALGYAAARYPMLQGEHHEQQHEATWSAARRKASS